MERIFIFDCFVFKDEHLLQRYYARADELFFQFCDKELVKINIFFAGNFY